LKAIGMLELNANNNEEILREAAAQRKAQFLRCLAKQYLWKFTEDDYTFIYLGLYL